MVEKKNDVQKELNKFLDQAKEGFKKFGKEVTVLAKKSEKEIVKASKLGKIQLDILSLNMQKEKLYYDIGKKVVSLSNSKDFDIPAIDSYLKKITKIELNAKKKKKELSSVGKPKK